jgi:hypothetical protein
MAAEAPTKKVGSLEWLEEMRDRAMRDANIPISQILEFQKMIDRQRAAKQEITTKQMQDQERVQKYRWSFDSSDRSSEVNCKIVPLPSPVSIATAKAEKRWPYYFARPQSDSEVYKNTSLIVMPKTQQDFMQGMCPRNKPLLILWFASVDVIFSLTDRTNEIELIRDWSHLSFARIRKRLCDHPKVNTLTDLVSMAPLVQDELNAMDETVAGVIRVKDWRFYEMLFMPTPQRLGVPLPVGLMLFEGRARTEAVQILNDGIRRAPFSTSWHPNAGLHFVLSPVQNAMDAYVLFAHTLMSDGILGVDVQKTCHRRESHASWNECEIIVQPLVRFHSVDEYVIVIEQDPTIHYTMYSANPMRIVEVRLVLTHAYLGDMCPCRAKSAAAAEARKNKLIPLM